MNRVYDKLWAVVDPYVHQPTYLVTEAALLHVLGEDNWDLQSQIVKSRVSHALLSEGDDANVVTALLRRLDEVIPHHGVSGIRVVKV